MLSDEIRTVSTPNEPAMSQSRHLRPITRDDLPQIETLFFDVFRGGKGNRAGFSQYFSALFLEGRHAGGGLVSDIAPGQIGAAIAFVPMRYRIYDEVVTAKLTCAFMADKRYPKAAARVVMSLRARHQDLLFTDSGSHEGVGHWLAGGGASLPVQALDWRCRFKPVSAIARKVRLPAVVDGLTDLADRSIEALRPRPAPQKRLEMTEIGREEFAALVPGMIARFPVRPDWTQDELLHLLGLAEENTRLGTLRYFGFIDRTGDYVGCLAAYFGPRKSVRVLDLLAFGGKEAAVAATMLAELGAWGAVEASGGAQPHMVGALSPHRGVSFRHRSFSCVATRFDSVKTAIERNEIYMGGLAGEGWSRLMTDFF